MDVDNYSVWQSVLGEIQIEVAPATYDGFFKNTEILKIADGIAEIAVAHVAAATFLEQRYYMLIKTKLEKRTGQTLSLIFSPKAKSKVEKNQKEEGENLFSSLSQSPPPSSVNIYARRAGLQEDFTFENFAVSGTNEMAHAAALAVAQEPGRAYNPFFLYGGVGVGKTHLMQAVGRHILAKNHDAVLRYLTGEEFTNSFIDSIRNKTTGDFKKQHRHADVLLFDDIQFIAGKEQVQEEFFHTFNAAMQGGGQIVLTSDRPPEEINKIDERIRSRFQAGLIVDIGAPNFELRCAIIKIKSEKIKINLPMETVQLLGQEIKSAREIEGALNKIKTFLQKNPETSLSPENLKDFLKINSAETIKKKANSWAEILTAVCSYFDVKETALKGERRLQQLVVPRQILMYLLKTEAGMTFSEIGNMLGGRDHTTIMHGVEKIETLVLKDSLFQQRLLEIKSKLVQSS